MGNWLVYIPQDSFLLAYQKFRFATNAIVIIITVAIPIVLWSPTTFASRCINLDSLIDKRIAGIIQSCLSKREHFSNVSEDMEGKKLRLLGDLAALKVKKESQIIGRSSF